MVNNKLLKEKVKARMLKNAARLWGAEGEDVELNFDPLVAMLFEGCVNEIEKIGNEIENTQVRVINRLAQLLIPDVITGYLPAHAIAFARPNDASCTINREIQFYFAKKIPNVLHPGQETIKEIFFSPALPVKLTNASLKYIAFKDRAYELITGNQKKLIAEAEGGMQLDHSSLWLAIEQNNPAEDLADLCFYFDLKNNPAKNTFLNLLAFTKWSINGEPLDTKMGFPVRDKDKITPEDEFDLDKRIESDVRSAYQKNFISVIGPLKNSYPQQMTVLHCPGQLKNVFAQKDLQKLTGNLRWINIEFPYAIADQMLGDLLCNINCFPIVNKRLNEFMFRLSQNLNVVPLNTDGHFFSVKDVHGTDGLIYFNNPLNPQNNNGGTYILRQGGIERFDSRNAREMINYLLDLLRDESAAFTILGNEFISSYLNQLNQTLTLLEQRSGEQGNLNEPTSYLLVNPRQEGENIFVSFWTTDGEISNNIKAGNKLELMGGGDIMSESILLMTTTIGGRARLSDPERLRAFRASLISRGRIVTTQDINMFCRLELGKEIEDLKVKKGFMIEEGLKSGFVQTIDVILKISLASQTTKNEWKEVCDNLANKLMQQSTGLTTIRVMTSDTDL